MSIKSKQRRDFKRKRKGLKSRAAKNIVVPAHKLIDQERINYGHALNRLLNQLGVHTGPRW